MYISVCICIYMSVCVTELSIMADLVAKDSKYVDLVGTCPSCSLWRPPATNYTELQSKQKRSHYRMLQMLQVPNHPSYPLVI